MKLYALTKIHSLCLNILVEASPADTSLFYLFTVIAHLVFKIQKQMSLNYCYTL